MNTTTLQSSNSQNRSPLRCGFVLALAVAWLAPWQLANAQCPQICDSTNGNTAFGNFALPSDGGFNNTAYGDGALYLNTTGEFNTAIGYFALDNNTGNDNVATGYYALSGNTTGVYNTATGANALDSNTSGRYNTASGSAALNDNTVGINNTANGYVALARNTTGNNNTATGQAALHSNRMGGNNTADGQGAMSNNTTGSFNIALGANAGNNLTTGDNNIDIGNVGGASEANTIRIGTLGTQTNTFIAGISGATVPTGVAVIVDTSGHLGTTPSSARFKDEIKPMDKASEAILALRPVTFRYKHELDPAGIPQFGLLAEDVEKVIPDLVARDEQGKPYTVRYEAVNAMLLNEFLKEHRKVEELEAKLAKQEKDFTARLHEQDAKIQQVSAQLEASKPAKQTVVSNP